MTIAPLGLQSIGAVIDDRNAAKSARLFSTQEHPPIPSRTRRLAGSARGGKLLASCTGLDDLDGLALASQTGTQIGEAIFGGETKG